MEEIVAQHLVEDEHGNQYRILEIQEYVDASSLDSRAKIPGMKRLETDSGLSVNLVDENTFEIVTRSPDCSKSEVN